MCGRYPSPSTRQLLEVWPNPKPKARQKELGINYDACPTQSLPVLVPGEHGLDIETYRWGLVPAWWKKPLKEVGSTINATTEKIKAKSGMWWGPFQRRRCLVPALGFYEWQLQADQKTKVRHFIKLRDVEMMTFAGIWDEWKQPDGTALCSYAIVTCPANPLMAKIHNNAKNSDGPRMPVILTGETAAAWTNPDSGLTAPDLLELLKPFSQDAMQTYPVVAESKAEPAKLIEAVGPEISIT